MGLKVYSLSFPDSIVCVPCSKHTMVSLSTIQDLWDLDKQSALRATLALHLSDLHFARFQIYRWSSYLLKFLGGKLDHGNVVIRSCAYPNGTVIHKHNRRDRHCFSWIGQQTGYCTYSDVQNFVFKGTRCGAIFRFYKILQNWFCFTNRSTC